MDKWPSPCYPEQASRGMGYAAYASAIPRSCNSCQICSLQPMPSVVGSRLLYMYNTCIRLVPTLVSICLFVHDADFKGRADLVPNCNLQQDTQGHCTRPHCFYKHTSNPPKKEVVATANSKRKEKAAKVAARNVEQVQQTLDLAKLNSMLSNT